MSLYEILAVAALAAAGGFAYRLYRSDTRPTAGDGSGRTAAREGGEPMFGRNRGRDSGTADDSRA